MSLKVSGSIPAWLHGDYIRNGPGTFKGMKHLFDGYGMLVKFSFKDGTVTTQQRQAMLVEPMNDKTSALVLKIFCTINLHGLQPGEVNNITGWFCTESRITPSVTSLDQASMSTALKLWHEADAHLAM